MATDYYSWEKMRLYATGEKGTVASLQVRLGPSHRRWLIVGHSETINREQLFKYVETNVLNGERLVHLGKEPLIRTGVTPTPDGETPDPNPTYYLPFRIIDKQFGSKTFHRLPLGVSFMPDGRIGIRALSARTVVPLDKLYPWLELDKHVESTQYYLGTHARYLFPGKGSQTATSAGDRKEFKDFLDQMSKTGDRRLVGTTCDVVPLFTPGNPVLREMLGKFAEVEQKNTKAAEVEPLMNGVVTRFATMLSLLAGQQLRGAQRELSPYSIDPELNDSPIVYAQDVVEQNTAAHMVQVDQLLRGARLSHCNATQRTSPEQMFVQELLAAKAETTQKELLTAEELWVTEANRELLQLVRTHQVPAPITNYRKALLDVRRWLLDNNLPTWDALNSITNDTPGGAAATLVVRNLAEAPGHRVYYWPLLGVAVVGCDHHALSQEELKRQLFMREVLSIEPKVEPFNGLTPNTFANRVGQTWAR